MRLLDLTDKKLFEGRDEFVWVHYRQNMSPFEVHWEFNPRIGKYIVDAMIVPQDHIAVCYARSILDFRMPYSTPVFTVIDDVSILDWKDLLSHCNQYVICPDEETRQAYDDLTKEVLAPSKFAELRKRTGVGVDWVYQATWDAPWTRLFDPAKQLLGNGLRMCSLPAPAHTIYDKMCGMSRAMMHKDPLRGQPTVWMVYRHLRHMGWEDIGEEHAILKPGPEGAIV